MICLFYPPVHYKKLYLFLLADPFLLCLWWILKKKQHTMQCHVDWTIHHRLSNLSCPRQWCISGLAIYPRSRANYWAYLVQALAKTNSTFTPVINSFLSTFLAQSERFLPPRILPLEWRRVPSVSKSPWCTLLFFLFGTLETSVHLWQIQRLVACHCLPSCLPIPYISYFLRSQHRPCQTILVFLSSRAP